MQPLRERVMPEVSIEHVMRSIDVLGRLAFGGQCVALMAMIAGPTLLVVASVVPFFLWGDGRPEAAVAVWLFGWAAAVGAIAGGIAFAVFCWRWSGDWITEWPGYATAGVIALLALGALAYMLTSTPVPIPASFAIAMGAAFAAGFAVAGHLAGTQVVEDTRHRQPVARRR